MGILERINGARIITVSFLDEPNEYGHFGYIDFVDDRWGKPHHRFAYIAKKDWETEIDGSQIMTIEVMLNQSLKNDNKVDIVIERRQHPSKVQYFDYLVKIDNLAAFQG